MAAKPQAGKPAEKGGSGDGSDPGDAGPNPKEVITFEDAMGEIESIVAEMEADRVPLDKLLADYERGSRLVRLCQKHLEEAQERIELIQAGGSDDDGSRGPVLVPFGGAAAAAAETEEKTAPDRAAATKLKKAKKQSSGEPDDDIRLL